MKRTLVIVLFACGGSDAPVVTRDAGAPAPTTSATPVADAGPAPPNDGLACHSGKDCPGAVCCRDAAYGTTPIGGSRCMPDCFTNLPRVQMCAAGETCQNGKPCQAFPSSCEGRAHPEQLYCDAPDGCE